jgi:malonyl CoA-acyl carrier protein transacylase
MTLVYVFPGQSSAQPDMIVEALRAHPAGERVRDAAHRVLGPGRAARYFDPAGTALACNRDVQIATFLATQIHLLGFAEAGVDAEASLGLSLGEYSHLVHIGALAFDDALHLVDERGRCYDDAPDGVMVTVLGADRETVAKAVAGAQALGTVVVSNVNAPTQHVIAGARMAVTLAASILENEHGAHTIEIESRVPMHSPLMIGVARAFTTALMAAPWRSPVRAYWPNATAAPLSPPTARDFVTLLARHVHEPVRWQASLDAILAAHPDAAFAEVGPGRVLTNLIARGWRGRRTLRLEEWCARA